VRERDRQKEKPGERPLRLLPGLLGLADFSAIEVSGQGFVLFEAEGLFQKLTGFFALVAREATGLDARGTIA